MRLPLSLRLGRRRRRFHDAATPAASGAGEESPPAPDHGDWRQDIDGLEVLHGEFATVTADGADHAAHGNVVLILQRVREKLGLDIVFTSELLGADPVVRQLPPGPWPPAAPGEVEHGALVLAMRCEGAKPSAQVLAVPVVARSRRVFGSVCCGPQAAAGAGVPPAEALAAVARMIALVLDRAPSTSDLPEVWDSSAAAPLGLN